ncbi:MAG: hypothetical protein WBI01_01555 [Syntrophomonadaceae bacterium]
MEATIVKIPGTKWGDLPEWGEPILRLLNERIFMTNQQIAKFFPIYGKGNVKRKLIKLADMNYLRRYEITTVNQTKPITGYTVGEEGFRITRKLIPELTCNKALEFIAANEFCTANGIEKPVFWVSKGLLVGEVKIDDQKYALWCPRQYDDRIQSLKSEVELSCRGLIVVSPSLKLISQIAGDIDIYVPVYFTTDSLLTDFMQYKDGSIQPL